MKLKNGIETRWFEATTNDEFYSVLDELKTDEDVDKFTAWINEEIRKIKC